MKHTIGQPWNTVRVLDWAGYYPVVDRVSGIVIDVLSASLDTAQEKEKAAQYEYDEVAEVYWTTQN